MVKAESVVLLVGDTHIGRKTYSFNKEVLAERMEILKENVYRVKKIINKSYSLPELHIFLLGDMIDGEAIFKGQAYKQDMDVVESEDYATDLFTYFVRYFARFFEKVHIWCVKGNHTRVSWSGSETNNMDTRLYRRLKDRFEVCDNVQMHIPDYSRDWFNIAEVRGHKFLMVHGDQCRMSSTGSLPHFSIERRVKNWKTGGIPETDFEVVTMGHFHTMLNNVANDVEILGNGTMVCGDDYPEKMGLKTQNKYWMFGVSDERPITWRFQIDLTRRG